MVTKMLIKKFRSIVNEILHINNRKCNLLSCYTFGLLFARAPQKNINKTMNLKIFDHSCEFDDIVFENRNKEYGAYELRKAYSGYHLTGFIISLLFFVLSIAIWFFLTNMSSSAMEKSIEINPLLIQAYTENIDLMLPQPPATSKHPAENPANMTIVTPGENPGKNNAGNIAIDTTDTSEDTLSMTSTGGGLEGDTNTAGGSGVYTYVENMPVFPGGQQGILEYLVNHTRYPVEAIQYNIYGTVEVIFYITKEGLVDNVKVAKSANPILDKEAVRVIKAMPKWQPGTRNGRPVTVMYKVPITFPQIVRKPPVNK